MYFCLIKETTNFIIISTTPPFKLQQIILRTDNMLLFDDCNYPSAAITMRANPIVIASTVLTHLTDTY